MCSATCVSERLRAYQRVGLAFMTALEQRGSRDRRDVFRRDVADDAIATGPDDLVS
jgi:hypothetical protein